MNAFRFNNKFHAVWNGEEALSPTALAHKWAGQQFKKAFEAAQWSKVWSWMWEDDNSFPRLSNYATVYETGMAKRQIVPIADIKGSAKDKSVPFDASIRPTSETCRHDWVIVAATFRLNHPQPPVELLKVGNHYFIQDGMYRLSVANWLGVNELVANITEATSFAILGSMNGNDDHFLDEEWAAYIDTYGFAHF